MIGPSKRRNSANEDDIETMATRAVMGGNDFMLLSELQVVLACNELRLEFLLSKIHKIGLRRDNSTKELVPQDLSRLMNH